MRLWDIAIGVERTLILLPIGYANELDWRWWWEATFVVMVFGEIDYPIPMLTLYGKRFYHVWPSDYIIDSFEASYLITSSKLMENVFRWCLRNFIVVAFFCWSPWWWCLWTFGWVLQVSARLAIYSNSFSCMVVARSISISFTNFWLW